MKLLLSAFIGSHNLGDEAIAEIVITKIEAIKEVKNLVVLSVDPSKTKRMVGSSKTKVVNAGFKNFFTELGKADGLVLGGGGIIQDESSVINILYYYLQCVVAQIKKKPVYMVFVGVGPIKSKLGSFALKRMSKLISYSLVRDVESEELLVRHKFKKSRIITAYDIVFNATLEPTTSKNTKLPENYILFCPRDWFFTRTFIPTKYALKFAKANKNSQLHVYRKSLLELVTEILKTTDLHVKGVAFFYTQDRSLLEWIQEELPSKYQTRFSIEQELLPSQYLNLSRHSKAVLGVRLHSLILGAVAKTRLVPLVYSSKVRSLVDYMAWTEFTTYLDKPNFPYKSTAHRLQKALSDGDALLYSRRLGEIQKANNEGFEKLVEKIISNNA